MIHMEPMWWYVAAGILTIVVGLLTWKTAQILIENRKMMVCIGLAALAIAGVLGYVRGSSQAFASVSALKANEIYELVGAGMVSPKEWAAVVKDRDGNPIAIRLETMPPAIFKILKDTAGHIILCSYPDRVDPLHRTCK